MCQAAPPPRPKQTASYVAAPKDVGGETINTTVPTPDATRGSGFPFSGQNPVNTPGTGTTNPFSGTGTTPVAPSTPTTPSGTGTRPPEFGGPAAPTPTTTTQASGFGPSATTSPGGGASGTRRYQWMTDWLADLGQRRPDLVGQRVNVFDPQFGFTFGDDGSWNGPLPDEYRNTLAGQTGFTGIRDNVFFGLGRDLAGGVGLGGTLDPRNLDSIGRGGTMRDALGTYGFAGSVGGTVDPNAPLWNSTPPPATPTTPTDTGTTTTNTRTEESGAEMQARLAQQAARQRAEWLGQTYDPYGYSSYTAPDLSLPKATGVTNPNQAVVDALMRAFRPDAWL